MAAHTTIQGSFTVPPTEENYEQIKIGANVRIGKDHGNKTNRISPPEISKRIQIVGYGPIDEDAALKLVGEILAGVTLLRRLHGDERDPYKVRIETEGEHGPAFVERTDFI
jgi:hypothetical protein